MRSRTSRVDRKSNKIMKISDGQLEEFADQFKREDFAAQVNTVFRVNQNFDAKLIEVSETKIYPRQESFSMLFLMPDDFSIVQGMYNFEHPQIGARDIFIVPIEQSSDDLIFEAVISRILPKD